jgi:parallel beta-helix repeat protein
MAKEHPLRLLLRLGVSACVAAGAVILTIMPARAATVRVVAPGQSIQAAIDAASPGDTVQLLPGTYHESVTISTDDITLRGAGDGHGGTVLEPPATFPNNFCAIVPPEPVPGHGAGICVLGVFDLSSETVTSYTTGDRVTGISVQGFPGDGISLVATKNVQVDHDSLTGSGAYGLADNATFGSVIKSNVIDGGSRAGVYYSSDDGVIAGNDVSNAGYGIALQDSNNVTVSGNYSHGNCDGYMDFDSSGDSSSGDNITVTGNVFSANNEICAGAPSINFPAIQGTGMVLIGSTRTLISGNLITGNTGDQPLSGGIALVTGQQYLGGPAEGAVVISHNRLSGNSPDDLLWDGVGSGITFTGNACSTSSPAGLCRS